MALDVQTIPGYVLVTCGGEMVIVAGVVVQPPNDPQPMVPVRAPFDLTPWLRPGRPLPPPTGPGGGGISSQVVNLTIPGMEFSPLKSHVDPAMALNHLLKSKSFGDLTRIIGGNYALTVAPSSTTSAEISAYVSDVSPSVQAAYWSPNA